MGEGRNGRKKWRMRRMKEEDKELRRKEGDTGRRWRRQEAKR